jgi:hypothetical protein
MPALDLALRLRMIDRAANVLNVAVAEAFREIAGDVGRAIVRVQTRPMNDMNLIGAGGLERHVQLAVTSSAFIESNTPPRPPRAPPVALTA